MESRAKQRPDCFILQKLPAILIFPIIDLLPPYSKAVLSQTCSTMHSSVKIATMGGLRPMATPKNRLEYLTLISRDTIDKWACNSCTKLHDVNESHTPQTGFWICPKNRPGVNVSCGSDEIQHHQVQITLKYSRLSVNNPQHRRYLESLLKPYYMAMVRTPTYQYECWVYPKVVEGRYLIQISRTYVDSFQPKIAAACSHQRYSDKPTTWPTADRVALTATINKARESRGVAFEGSCLFCATDFCVIFQTDMTIKVHSWHDMGPEATALHPDWIATRSAAFTKDGEEPPAKYNNPGTVRAKYEAWD